MDLGILKGLLGFLIIGVLFYLVVRRVRTGGCCGHSDGEHNQDTGHSKERTITGKTSEHV